MKNLITAKVEPPPQSGFRKVKAKIDKHPHDKKKEKHNSFWWGDLYMDELHDAFWSIGVKSVGPKLPTREKIENRKRAKAIT